MTVRWGLTHEDVRDEVKTLLVEHGWSPLVPYPDETETVMCVDVDEAAELIARALVAKP